MLKDDEFFDLVHSEDVISEVELNDITPQEYYSPQKPQGKKKLHVRPRSGYLFPLNRVMSSPAHKAIINRYFDDPNSSLNKSFMEIKEEDEHTEVSAPTMAFKIIWFVITILWNSWIFVLPNFLATNIFSQEKDDVYIPVILNLWRVQWAAIFLLLFAFVRKVLWIDIYFQNGIFSKLTFHSTIAGISLAIWSTGIMYATEISSPFNAYLLGYAFPPVLSGVIIMFSLVTSLKNICSKSKGNNSHLNQISNIESSMSVFDKKPKSKDVFNWGEFIKSQHFSLNERYGTGTFFVGVGILILSRVLNLHTEDVHKSYLTGDLIALLSTFFGIIFQWIFLYYSMKQIYKIIEFITIMYLAAAIFMTIVSVLFFDDSEYKQKSLWGWASYPSNTIYAIWGFLILGGVWGFGTKIFRIVKGEKFLAEDKVILG